uniref:F-box domain-containing protein n=1 Tax=Lactuca sativa TaxID=4236 RepID=A0A9R1UNL7_LACSA|nr:hypothetical protein LSAT_V11C800425060 [Lactuca sativa]
MTTRITALPSQMIEKIVTMVGGKSPIDGFKCQLVCKLFRDSSTSDEIYQTMDTNRLRFHPYSIDMYEVLRKCRKLNNPHILFNNECERNQEALIMLNHSYINTRRSWNQRQTCYKVRIRSVRGRRSKQIQFHGLHKSCAKHPSVRSYGKALMHQYSSLFNCDICLWYACLVKFARMLEISLE